MGGWNGAGRGKGERGAPSPLPSSGACARCHGNAAPARVAGRAWERCHGNGAPRSIYEEGPREGRGGRCALRSPSFGPGRHDGLGRLKDPEPHRYRRPRKTPPRRPAPLPPPRLRYRTPRSAPAVTPRPTRAHPPRPLHIHERWPRPPPHRPRPPTGRAHPTWPSRRLRRPARATN